MFLQLYREIFVAIVPISRFFFTILSKAFIESFGSCTDYILLGTNTSTFGGKKNFGFSPRSFVFRSSVCPPPENYLRQASCMKPEAQVPSAGSLFRPVTSPACVQPIPTTAGVGEGVGKVFLFCIFTGSAGSS